MVYMAGVYSRISRDDGDKAESDSLANQREIVKTFVKRNPDIEIVEYYNDDNYSGTNFDRPDFIRMYDDIKTGKINCVIVKDLSRLGRDYIEVGNYIQRVFPRYGVRFIAINDGVDSLSKQYDMITPIKNIFNEQYARDISNKIISTIRNKQESGKFIGAFASYGYLKDPENKHHLIVDSYAAEVVRMIFQLFCSGYGKISIAKILNEKGILCPSEYKKSIGQKYSNSHKLDQTNYWTYSTVNNILKNEIYIGNMVQHKNNASKFDYSSATVDKKDWIIVENTHEPIIDRTTWDTAQALLKRRTRQLSLKQNVSCFAGFLVCGDCKRAMAKIACRGQVRYVCGSYKRYSSGICSAHKIYHEQLTKIVLNDINSIISKVDNLKRIVQEELVAAKDDKCAKGSSIENVKHIEAQIDKTKHLKKSLYEDHKAGLLTKDEFVEYKADYDKQITSLEQMIAQMKQEKRSGKEILLESEFIKNLKNKEQITQLDRTVLESFYEKIEIYEDKRIKFFYKFTDVVNMIKDCAQSQEKRGSISTISMG